MILLCRKSVTLKCASNDCYREASLYCKKSAKYFCEKCTGKHDALPTELNFHPVKRSHWSNSMLPYCKDHDAFEKLFCLSCAKLCCKYCKYEFHSEHTTMTLEDYNKAKYEETITKELQKLSNLKISCEELRKGIEGRSANHKRMETDFFKSLTERKNILIAKCIHMICDIEKKYQENYCKMKSKYDVELLQKLSGCDHAMADYNNIFDQEEKYSNGNSIEKFYNLNQLVVNIKECNKSFNELDPRLEYGMDFDHSHDKDDELLFQCLHDSFGVSLTLYGAHSENCDDLKKDFTYNPNLNFKKLLKNNKEICSFIKRTLDLELDKLNTLGKYCDRLLYFTCDGVVIEKNLQFDSPNIN